MPTSRRRKRKSVKTLSRQLTSKQTTPPSSSEDTISNPNAIEGSIEFAPEYYQSGAATLSYFSEILRQKNSGVNAKARIEQKGSTLRLRIELPSGNIEVIEKELDKHDIVIAEQEFAANSIYSDRLWQTNAFEAIVIINLPQEDIDISTIKRIRSATNDFMEALGFELEAQDEPVFGSFFQRLRFLWKGEIKQEANEIYSKGKVALEAQFIDLPSAEVTNKLANAAAALITAVAPLSDAAIRCGSLLIVKVTKDGIPKVVIETVSPELTALLNKNPALLQNPSIVFDLISGIRAPDRTIEKRGSAELAE